MLPPSSTLKIEYGLYTTSEFSTPLTFPVPVPNKTVVPGSITSLHLTYGNSTIFFEHTTYVLSFVHVTTLLPSSETMSPVTYTKFSLV